MNVSKGDLAYIIASDYPELIGRVVNVLRWADDHSEWEIEFVGTMPDIVVRGLELVARHALGPHLVCAADEVLRRIAGPGIKTDITTDEPICEGA